MNSPQQDEEGGEGRRDYFLLDDNEEDELLNVSRNVFEDENPILFEDDPPPSEENAGGRPRLYSRTEPVELNGLNYLNLVTYLFHLFVSWGIGVWGLDGILPTRWDVRTDYETLVTPARWAYSLWAPILLFEAIFAIAQLFPYYRARPIVVDGTGYFFFYTCLIQSAWTLFVSVRLFVCSFVAVVSALISLVFLLTSQHTSLVRGRKSRLEYWLFRFPFYLHCGWMVLMSTSYFSMLFRHLTSNTGVQLAADIVALGVMLPVAAFFLTGQPSGPDFVIPLVIVWSYIGIGCRLNHPSEVLLELYDHYVIVAVRDAAWFFAGTVGCIIVPRVIIWIAHEFLTIQVLEWQDWESGEQRNSQDGFY